MNPVLKLIARIHAMLMQISGGRVGNKMGGNHILLLHHIGAKSGKKYATPLAYVEDGDSYAIIASAGGQANHPGWYHNLKANPNTTIEIMGQSQPVKAQVAPKAKRDKLWAEITAEFSQFSEYQKKTSREIPIVLLHPQA